MSLRVPTDRGPAEFALGTCGCHYGALLLPDVRSIARGDSVDLARWILSGGHYGIDEDRAPIAARPCGPKPANHPSVGRPCPICHEPFAAGDMTVLVPLGPHLDDPAEVCAARDGHAYTLEAVETHIACEPAPMGEEKP